MDWWVIKAQIEDLARLDIETSVTINATGVVIEVKTKTFGGRLMSRRRHMTCDEAGACRFDFRALLQEEAKQLLVAASRESLDEKPYKTGRDVFKGWE